MFLRGASFRAKIQINFSDRIFATWILQLLKHKFLNYQIKL